MKRMSMKYLTALVLVLVLLCTQCLACSGGPDSPENGRSPDSSKLESGSGTQESGAPEESDALRVLVDIEFSSPWMNSPSESMGKRLVDNLKLSGERVELGQVEFEYLPKEGADRAAALTRTRTEIMSGKGPDLFLCGCTNPQIDEQPLFRFPDQVMKQGLFLPLDEYFDKARFTDFDKLLPIAMEAGRNEEGQLLAPLAFTMPITVFRKSEVQHEHSRTMTRAQQLAGDDAMRLSAAAEPTDCLYRSAGFRELADYESETLCFSEEELGEYLEECSRLFSEQDELDAPDCFTTGLSVNFIDVPGADVVYFDSSHHGGLRSTDSFTMTPIYSNEGGYGAYITSFAAINRNTQKPEEAFLLLDYLLSPTGARSELYGRLLDRVGMPVHMDLGEMGAPVAAVEGGVWWMSDENYQEYCSLRNNISAIRFSTPFELEIRKAYWEIDSIAWKRSQGEKTDSAEKILADAYRTMKMELAES